jgi:hypothetical protein
MAEKLKLERSDLDANNEIAKEEAAKAVRKGRLTSGVTTLVVHLIILLLLMLVFIAPPRKEVPQITAVTTEGLEKDNLNKKDFARSVQQKPMPAQSASRVKPITAAAVSAVSVPSVEDPVEEPLGIGVDFGRGFGYGKGRGGGGGGGTISFFGASAQGNRAVFIVDFSSSMQERDLAGGTRIERLKKELINSINKLPKGVQFQVIYYSTAPWIGGETLFTSPTRFPDQPADRIPWSAATKEGIARAVSNVNSAKPEGATLWGPPLKLAMAMKPAPNLIYLLSDGLAQDAEEVMDEIGKINPLNVPIHTIGLEVAGVAYHWLVSIARQTGGQYSIVHKGRLYSGAASLQFAKDEFEPDF